MKHPIATPRLLGELAAVVLMVEFIIMMALPGLAPGASHLVGGLIDVTVLTVVSAPLLIWRVHAAIARSLIRAQPTDRLRGLVPALVACTAIIGSAVSAGVWMGLNRLYESEARSRFDDLAGRAERRAIRSNEQVVFALMGLRGALLSREKIECQEFREYVGSLDIERQLPGVLGLAFMEHVTREDLDSWLACEHQEDPDFSVKTTGEAPDLWIVRHIEPHERNQVAWGLDGGAEPVRREAVERAVETGLPTISGPIELVQDQQARVAYLFCLAIYRPGVELSTLQARRDALIGVACAPVILELALADVPSVTRGQIDLQIFDGPTPNRSNLLFDLDESLGRPDGLSVSDDLSGRTLSRSSVHTLGQRTWTITSSTTSAFDAAAARSVPAVAGAASLAFSLLLSAVIWSLGSSGTRAVRLAGEMTADLAAAKFSAEQALRAAQALQVTIDRHAIVSITDAQGAILSVNDAFCAISGYSRDELVGRNHRIVNSGVHPRAFFASMWKTISAGEPWRGEVCNRAKDGSLYWVDSMIAPFRDASGKIERYISIRTDVTARKLAEVEQAASIAAATALLQANTVRDAARRVNDCLEQVTGLSRTAVLLFDNDGVCRFHGWRGISPVYRSQVEGHCPWRQHESNAHPIVHNDVTADPSLEAYAETFRQERIAAVAFIPLLSSEGVIGKLMLYDTVPGRFTDSVVRSAGIVAGALSAAVARLRLAEQLAANEARFRAVIDTAMDAVVSMDGRGMVKSWNPQAQTTFGWSPLEAIGKPLHDLILPEEHRAEHLRNLQRFARGGEDGELARRVEVPALRKDGRRLTVEMAVTPVTRGVDALFSVFLRDVTEARLVQAKAEYTSQMLRHTGAMARIGGWELDPRTGDTLWTEQLYRIHELEPGTPTNVRDGIAFYAPEARDRITLAVKRAIENHEPFDVELPLITAKGRHIWVHSVGEPVIENGVLTKVCGAFQDVTDQVLQRMALEEQAKELELTVRGAGLGTWDWDLTTGDVIFNHRWAEMLGYDVEEIEPTVRAWEHLVHPDDKKKVADCLSDHIEGRTLEYRCEHRLRRKDGSWCWVLDAGQIIARDPDGKATRACGVHVDLSRVYAAGEALAAKERLIRTILDVLPQRIFWKDAQGRYLGCNKAFLEDSGLPDVIGLDDFDMPWKREEAEFYRSCDERVRESNTPEMNIIEHQSNSAGTQRWLMTNKLPLRNQQGEAIGVVGTYQDVTSMKNAERALIEAKELAEAATRSKSEFLANMSHEIRTPMTAILGYADLLAEDGSRVLDDAARKEYVQTIRRNGEHLLAIINDILDISKIEAGKMIAEAAPVDLRQFVAELLAILSFKAAGKGISLDASFDTPVPQSVNTDPLRLRQILMNLMGNAIKFTESGGVQLRISFEPPGVLRFAIEDTGVGLAPEQIQRLFGAFMQVDASATRRHGGTGLGLLISRRLATLLGGEIGVSSTPGKGSVFTVTIAAEPIAHSPMLTAGTPITPKTASAPPEPPAPAPAAQPLAGTRILLAEDGPDNLRLISFHLRKAGADVRTVENGKLALEALSVDGTVDGPLVQPPPVDLVLTDMQMPELDGYALARLLRAKGWSLPIVAITAHAMQGDVERCMEAGCTAFIPKPIDKRVLVETCQAMRSSPASPERAAAA